MVFLGYFNTRTEIKIIKNKIRSASLDLKLPEERKKALAHLVLSSFVPMATTEARAELGQILNGFPPSYTSALTGTAFTA